MEINTKRTFNQMASQGIDSLDGTRKIAASQLSARFRSKTDIYRYLTEVLNMHLPPTESVNKDYLRQILKEEKKVFTNSEIKIIKVPKYEELSVKNIMLEIGDDKRILEYLPDMNGKKKPIDRQYFFTVLNTLEPDYTNKIIKHAQDLRYDETKNEEKKNYILVSDRWHEKLLQHPFVSSKLFECPGKTIHLLKESTKIVGPRKPKQKQEVGVSFKRLRGENSQMIFQKPGDTKMKYTNLSKDSQPKHIQSQNSTPKRLKIDYQI